MPSARASVFYIRRLRVGLTQAELASAIGVSRQTISAIERREATPSVRVALAIARRLETTVEDLFG